MKTLFNGKETVLSNPSPEKNLALATMLDSAGYQPRGAVKRILSGPAVTIVVNYYNSPTDNTNQYAAVGTSFACHNRVSFEDFILEIFTDKPEEIVLELSHLRKATVNKIGTVSIERGDYKKLGYTNDNPSFSFLDIHRISQAIEQLKR